MKICFISDTHCYLGSMMDKIPYDCDVLVHCGDYLSSGYMHEFAQFAKELGQLSRRFDLVLITAGNHDIITEKETEACRTILRENGSNVHMLINESFEHWGIKFYGSPYTPRFYDWAWMYNHNRGGIIWDMIPLDTDILFTHGMPKGILDAVGNFTGDRIIANSVGCPFLRDRIKVVKPKIYAGGHLHLHGGKTVIEDGTLFINAAMVDEGYIPTRNPIIVEIDEFSKEVTLLG